MSPETPLATIAPSYPENASQEQKDTELAEPQQLQLTSPSALEETTEGYQGCGEGSGDVSRDAESESSTLRYDTSSCITPQFDLVLKSTWGTSSQTTSCSMQSYDLCPSDENLCYSRKALLSDSMSKSEDELTGTANSSTFLLGSFVSMYHDSDYVNLHQKPQEVMHWYRTERVSGEQDEWEVVEVGFDGTMDGAMDARTLEVVGYPVTKTLDGPEIQLLMMPQRVVQLEREVVGDEVLAETDLNVACDGAVDTEDSDSDGEEGWSPLFRVTTYPLCEKASKGMVDSPEDFTIGLVERELERMLWYNLGVIIHNRKRAESRNIKGLEEIQPYGSKAFDVLRDEQGLQDGNQRKALQPYSSKAFDMLRDVECYYPQSEEQFPFGGLDGASESKVAPPHPRPARRYYRTGRPVQRNKNTMNLSTNQVGPQVQKSPEKEFAKNWLQTQMQRARNLPDHLKSNEDRLLQWLNTDIDGEAAPLSAEAASFTMQMFGLLKPGGAFSGVFAPGGAMAAHTGTYLAAHSAVLGVLPTIGMSKCNCVHCNQEVGGLGSGVWWRCKGCPIGKGFICGNCFLSGGKCGSGHIVGSQYSHSGEAGHVLVRHGFTASVEDFNIRFHNEWQGGPDLTSDKETYSPPRVTRRSKSESHTAAIPRSGTNSISIQANASKTQELLLPHTLAPQGGSLEHTPPQNYSPPPHVPKARTGSVSSLLPAIPTPSPSPPPRETLRQKLATAVITTAAEGSQDSTTPLLAISVPGSIGNEGRELGTELMTSNVNKLRPGAASGSASTLGISRGDEQENFTGVSTGGLQSIAGSDDSSESSSPMTTGAGGYKGIPWRMGNTGSPGPSELMNLNFDQEVGLRAAAAFGSAAEGLESESRPRNHVDSNLQLTLLGTPGWEGERERIVLERERERKMAEVVVRLPPPPPPPAVTARGWKNVVG